MFMHAFLQTDRGEAASHPAQPGAGGHARPVRGVLAAGQHPQPRRGPRPAPQIMEVSQLNQHTTWVSGLLLSCCLHMDFPIFDI